MIVAIFYCKKLLIWLTNKNYDTELVKLNIKFPKIKFFCKVKISNKNKYVTSENDIKKA